jgi:hypothetical protein
MPPSATSRTRGRLLVAAVLLAARAALGQPATPSASASPSPSAASIPAWLAPASAPLIGNVTRSLPGAGAAMDPPAAAGDLFGSALAISLDGSALYVGAPGVSGNRGAVFVFALSGGGAAAAPA